MTEIEREEAHQPLDQEELFHLATEEPGAPGAGAASKKERILALFRQGETEVANLVRETGASPSYVASVLTSAGLLQGYFDLYTTTSLPQNIYSKFFRGVLSFKSIEAARESVRRIDRLHHYFELLGDRAGQHHAQVVALTGRNRARWSGKHEEAKIFAEWLLAH